MPVSVLIWPIKGATEVSAGRRLAAKSTIANMSSMPPRREGVSVAGDFFVMPPLSDYLPYTA
jgi:hypothetical protein